MNSPPPSQPAPAAAAATTGRRSNNKMLIPARVGKFVPVRHMPSIRKVPGFGITFIAWGLPMLAFIVGGAWVVAQALEGKTKEYETSKGVSSM